MLAISFVLLFSDFSSAFPLIRQSFVPGAKASHHSSKPEFGSTVGKYFISPTPHNTKQKLKGVNCNINNDDQGPRQSRRDILQKTVMSANAVVISSLLPQRSLADTTAPSVRQQNQGELIDVYFGCGCFWHVQHEFVEAERKILSLASDERITARAGYAGGKAGASSDGKVCYHNALGVADYGDLGHAEVVSLRIPSVTFYDFAVEYFKLFDKDGNRPDQFGDRGSEYRNLVGVPGGAKSEYAKQLLAASIATGDKLDFAVGKGDDKDLRAVTFIMDTERFPAFVAEQYHQFHDGFNFGENYPGKYNALAGMFAKDGERFGSCPNGALGIGVGGL